MIITKNGQNKTRIVISIIKKIHIKVIIIITKFRIEERKISIGSQKNININLISVNFNNTVERNIIMRKHTIRTSINRTRIKKNIHIDYQLMINYCLIF